MKKNSKIYICGHKGMVGSSILRELKKEGYTNLIFKTHEKLDLLDKEKVEKFFQKEKPEYVFLCAAKVGGIMANANNKADFLYENIFIELNVIKASYNNKVKKLLFLGSSCIYPKYAKQPITEDSLLTSSLEPTNEGYALAKIAGLKYCEYLNKEHNTNYIYVMPCNLYGPNDNYQKNNSHVLAAFIRRFHEAKITNKKEVICWGTGSPLREFMYVDDLAKTCIFLMNKYDKSELINIGTGEEISIKDLAKITAKIVGYKGRIKWDSSKPDGTPRKVLNIDKLKKLGINYHTNLEEGIKKAYNDFKKHEKLNIILLAGGTGERLKEISGNIPKQFLKVFNNNKSMLQNTFSIIKEKYPTANIIIATNKNQVELVKKDLGNRIIITSEPSQKNTFPAVCLATLYLTEVLNVSSNDKVIACPIDSLCDDDFFDNLELLNKQDTNISLIGVKAEKINTGYGYIIAKNNSKISKIEKFIEKPDFETAKNLVKNGTMYNSGVACYKIKYILNKTKQLLNSNSYNELYKKYNEIESISIDYALNEKEKNINVIKYDGKWTDIGSIEELKKIIK